MYKRFSVEQDDQAAYADVDLVMPSGVELFDARSDQTPIVLSAVENALEDINSLNRIKKILSMSTEGVSNLSKQLIGLTLEQIQNSTGIAHNQQLALATEENYTSVALESISDLINKIIDAIKKAFSYIWEKITDLFKYISSFSNRNQQKARVNKAVEDVEKVHQEGAIDESQLPYIRNVGLLRRLDIGLGSEINSESLNQLLHNVEQFVGSLYHLSSQIRIGVISLNAIADTFRKEVHKHIEVPESNQKISFDDFKRRFYDQIKASIDLNIEQHFQDAHISEERNLCEELKNRSHNELENPIDFTPQLIGMKAAPTLGGLVKLFFVLYEGEYQSYQASLQNQIGLSRISETGGRVLEPGQLSDFSKKFLTAKDHIDSIAMGMEKDLKVIKKVLEDTLSKVSVLNALNIDKTLDPNDQEQYMNTIMFLFGIVKHYQRFIEQAFIRGMRFGLRSINSAADYIDETSRLYTQK